MNTKSGIIQSFSLQWRAMWRTGTLPFCAAAAVLAVVAAPHIARGDGTAAGARQVLAQLALGGAFSVVAVVSLVAACGAFADERAAKRLALTVTRPVPLCGVWLGKFAAILSAAAVSLSAAAVALFCVAEAGGDCVRLMPPVMPRSPSARRCRAGSAAPRSAAARTSDTFPDPPATGSSRYRSRKST